MPFPDSHRIIYAKNPLVEVISQLKFPTILSIEAELPATFQDKLRSDYPVFEDGNSKSAMGMSMIQSEALPQELIRLFNAKFAIPAAKLYAFSTADGVWTVTLNREFVAISCKRYEKWDLFRARLSKVVKCLEDVYQPSFYTRIGLRYRNVIDRKALGLQSEAWGELFESHLAAELGSGLADCVVQNQHQLLVNLPNGEGGVRIIHGITEADTYMIDDDFFIEEQVEKNNALEKLDTFNKRSGGLFRSFIKSKLATAMEPTEA